MMNLISADGQVIFMTVHGGGGRLTLDLTAPLLRVADDQTGTSVTFTMLAEPPEESYAETRLYRYDEPGRSFSILDAVFAPSEQEKVVGDLENMKRYAWLPAAFDVEGNYIPAAVLTARVTDGSLGLIEQVKMGLVQVLRQDPVLAAYHPQWGESAEEKCHVLNGSMPGGRTSGRTPFIEVETDKVGTASPFFMTVSYRLTLVTTAGLDAFADDVSGAILAAENRSLNSQHVLDVRLKLGQPERTFPLKRTEMTLEVDLAAKA
jgi:hypothetical protein